MVRAKIALNDGVAADISCKGSVGTGYYACPAPDALLGINGDCPGYGVFVHSTSEAGIYTPGLSTVAALDGKANLAHSFHADARQRFGTLLFKCLDYIFGLRMFRLAVNATESTAHTDFLSNVDDHESPTIHIYGIRQPFTLFPILSNFLFIIKRYFNIITHFYIVSMMLCCANVI